MMRTIFIITLFFFISVSHADSNTVSGIGKYEKDSVFAKILDKRLPAKIIFENEYVLAFEDIHPIKPVHILIIPKGEYRSLIDFSSKASDKEITALIRAMGKISAIMGIDETGFSMITNSGHDGGQTVPHLHFHLLGGEPVHWETELRNNNTK